MARPNSRDRGLYEHPKGSGVWWICYFDQAGRRHREKVGPKGLARKLYEKRKTEIRERRYFPPEKRRLVLFDEVAENFLSYSRQANRSTRMDQFRMKALLKAFGGMPAEDVTAEQVEEFKFRLGAKRSPATVNRHLALMKAAYNRAMRAGKVSRNPVRGVPLFRENNLRVRYLSDAEERRLLAALPGYLRPLVIVAIHTGLRQAELFSLQWRDVDLCSGVLSVARAKSGEGRAIPLNSVSWQMLKRIFEEKNQRSLAKSDTLVFQSLNGGFLHNLRRTWASAVRRAKIENLRFHDLRHTFASHFVMRGGSLKALNKMLGHSSLRMTARYAHSSEASRRAAVETLSGICRESSVIPAKFGQK